MTDHIRTDDAPDGERRSEPDGRTTGTSRTTAAPECNGSPNRERPIGDVVEHLVGLVLHGPYLTDPAERTDDGDEE